MEFEVMGMMWKLKFVDEDPALRDGDAYCDPSIRTIVLLNHKPEPGELNDMVQYTLKTMRHEVVHAYLYECGLGDNALSVDCWPKNEEMIDWFAIIGPRIAVTWKILADFLCLERFYNMTGENNEK